MIKSSYKQWSSCFKPVSCRLCLSMCHILSVKPLFIVVGEGDRRIDLSTRETDKTTRGLCKHKQSELHCQPPWLTSLSSVFQQWGKNSPSVPYKAETTFYSSTETPLRPWRRTCTCRDTKRESIHLSIHSIHSETFFLYVQQNILMVQNHILLEQKDPLWLHRTSWGMKKNKWINNSRVLHYLRKHTDHI